MTSNVCPTCGAICGPVETPPLSPPEADLLRAARMRKDQAPFRVSDLSKWSGWSYQRAWRSMNLLQIRGYMRREGERWVPMWDRLSIPHRAAVALEMDADTPDGAELRFGEPGKWARRLGWVLAHFGGSIVEG